MTDAAIIGAKVAVPAARGLCRPRLDDRLDRVWRARVALVIAPAGSGKTTLLAQWANRSTVPVAWYHAEADDSAGGRVLSHLEGALSRALGIDTGGWSTVEQALASLDQWHGMRALLIIDDLHVLRSSEAMEWLGRFIGYLPPYLRVVVAARQSPGLDLSRLRLDGDLVELGPDDLRFRHWEVESLFHHHYHDQVDTHDLADIHRRTNGWAAGLQLFHLALGGKPASGRRRVLDGLATQNRLLRDYLARNVLEDLEPELREFLVLTSPLGVLTGELCDQLLDRTDSSAMLALLEERQLFTSSHDDGLSYVYHEIFRSHLEGLLVEQSGEMAARSHIRRAGQLLLEAAGTHEAAPNGLSGAALRALCRADAWDEVSHMLGVRGNELAGEPGGWLDNVPARLADEDPWLLLASARRHLSTGALGPALAAYRRCEPNLPDPASSVCRQELVAAAAWATPMPTPVPGPAGVLRRAVARHPVEAMESALALGSPTGRVVAGVSALIGGDVAGARRVLDGVLLEIDQPVVEVAAKLALSLATLLSTGDIGQARTHFTDLAAQAEVLVQPWLARLACALLALTGEPEAAETAALGCRLDGDAWGELLASLLEGAGRLRTGQSAADPLARAVELSRVLGAATFESWATSCLALSQALAGQPEAGASAERAEALARSAGVRGAQDLAGLTQERLSGPRPAGSNGLGREPVAAYGPGSPILTFGAVPPDEGQDARVGRTVRPPPSVPSGSGFGSENEAAADEPSPGLSIRCLGGLTVWNGGAVIDVTALRPRARSLLSLLALSPSRPLHWEVLAASFWPEADPRSAGRNLQTAVSSVRRVLGAPGSHQHALKRVGEAYVLEMAESDIAALEQALRESERARVRGDGTTEAHSLQRALALYRGHVLPEAGPAEWVVGHRDRIRWQIASAAERLAKLELARGDHGAAVAATERGLFADSYRTSLWDLLISALEQSGDSARLAVARRRQAEVLARVGVTVD